MTRKLIALCKFLGTVGLVSTVAGLCISTALQTDAPQMAIPIAVCWLLLMIPALADYLDA